MRGFLAVARREIVEHRMVLAAAVFAGLVPIAVPLARGLSGADAADARSLTALILSAAFAAGTAIALGATMLTPKIANRRIAFDLARPVSALALWGGRLVAATLLALVSATLVWIPASIAGVSAAPSDLPVTLPIGGLLVLAAVVMLFSLFHAVTVAVASRSTMIALDAVLALAMWYGASAALAHLPMFMAAWPFQSASMSLIVVTIAAMIGAGYVSVARGRTDIRAAHRALSLALWVPVGAAVLGANGYARWVMAARPDDLGEISGVTPAPDGGWIVIGGRARGAYATFLYDTVSGRFSRAAAVNFGWPVFSLDGKRTVWVEGRDQGGPLPVWTWDLADPGAAPSVRTRLLLKGYPSLTVLSDDGSRLATMEEGLLSIHDIAASNTIASVRVANESAYPRGFFVSRDVFRLYRVSDIAPDQTRLEILEFDVASRRLQETGAFSMPRGWCYLAADRAGDRLIVEETQTKEVWLLDGRNGRLLSTLAEALPGKGRWPGFLADGRPVISASSSTGRALHVFSREGVPTRVVPFPGAAGLALGGEVSPGKLVVAIGDGPMRRIELVDVDTGERRRIADNLFPAARLAALWNQPNAVPAVGSNATKLFYQIDDSLIRLDPVTGQRRIILGGARH